MNTNAPANAEKPTTPEALTELLSAARQDLHKVHRERQTAVGEFGSVDVYEIFREIGAKYFTGIKFTVTELKSLTPDQLKLAGLGTWDAAEDKSWTDYLLPPHILAAMADGEELLCPLDGTTGIVGKDHLDNDIRCGCTAWGFRRTNTPEEIAV